jgi:hypothetical protein
VNNTKADKDAWAKEPLYTDDGNINYCSHYRNQYGSFLNKKPNMRTTISSCYITPGHLSERMYVSMQ